MGNKETVLVAMAIKDTTKAGTNNGKDNMGVDRIGEPIKVTIMVKEDISKDKLRDLVPIQARGVP